LLEAVSLKVTSVLTLIDEEAFKTGIERLREHIDSNSNDESLLFDEMTVTIGHRQSALE